MQPLEPGPDLAQVFLPVDGMPLWPEPASYCGALAEVLFVSGLVFLVLPRRGFPRALFASLAAGGLLGLIFAFGERGPYGLVARLPPMAWFRVPVRYLLSWSLAVALGSALVLSFWLGRAKRRSWVGWACLALLAADLVFHARRAAPTAPADVWQIEPAAARALRQRLGADALGFPRRFLSIADPVYPIHYRGSDLRRMLADFESLRWANGMRWGLESVAGDGPTLRRTTELFRVPSVRAAELGGVGAILESLPRPAASPASEARRLAIRDFQSLPRAILVPEAVAVAESEALRATLSPKVDPRRTAVLEDAEPLAADACVGSGGMPPSAWWRAGPRASSWKRGFQRPEFSCSSTPTSGLACHGRRHRGIRSASRRRLSRGAPDGRHASCRVLVRSAGAARRRGGRPRGNPRAPARDDPPAGPRRAVVRVSRRGPSDILRRTFA